MPTDQDLAEAIRAHFIGAKIREVYFGAGVLTIQCETPDEQLAQLTFSASLNTTLEGASKVTTQARLLINAPTIKLPE